MSNQAGGPPPWPKESADGSLPAKRLSTLQKIRICGFIAVLAVVNIAFRLVYATGESRTAALYVGIPAILAIGLALLPPGKSSKGTILKGATLAMLLACVILPEGLLCLLFALPLVALISVIVGSVMDASKRRDADQNRGPGRPLVMVGLPLLILSLEGVIGSPFDANNSATASITVQASPSQVAKAIATTPRFQTPTPLFLKVGFNRPVSATGSGLQVGDKRAIEFTGGDHDDHPLRLFGITGHRSVDHMSRMDLTVVESSPGRVVFAVDHDMTMLTRWADLNRAIVTWEPIDAERTKVTWKLQYRRLLNPTFYFGPLQHFGMGQAADYLLETVIKEQLR